MPFARHPPAFPSGRFSGSFSTKILHAFVVYRSGDWCSQEWIIFVNTIRLKGTELQTMARAITHRIHKILTSEGMTYFNCEK
jgi:hypothetical protein